jgi:hypothetical protein
MAPLALARSVHHERVLSRVGFGGFASSRKIEYIVS